MVKSIALNLIHSLINVNYFTSDLIYRGRNKLMILLYPERYLNKIFKTRNYITNKREQIFPNSLFKLLSFLSSRLRSHRVNFHPLKIYLKITKNKIRRVETRSDRDQARSDYPIRSSVLLLTSGFIGLTQPINGGVASLSAASTNASAAIEHPPCGTCLKYRYTDGDGREFLTENTIRTGCLG